MEQIRFLVPEILILIAALAATVSGSVRTFRNFPMQHWIGLIGAVVALTQLGLVFGGFGQVDVGHVFLADGLSYWIRAVALVWVMILIGERILRKDLNEQSQFMTFLLGWAFSLMLMSETKLSSVWIPSLMVFLLSTAALSYWKSAVGSEAWLRLLISVSWWLPLFVIALSFDEYLPNKMRESFLILPFLFFVGVFPFQRVWVDQFHGSPLLASGPWLVGSRAIALVLFARFLMVQPSHQEVMFVVLGLGAVLAAFLGLWQKDARRLLGHWVVIQSVFFAAGLWSFSTKGSSASVAIATLEPLAVLGSARLLTCYHRGELQATRGLTMITILLLGFVVGLPGTIGFAHRLVVLQSLFDGGHVVFAGVLVVAMGMSWVGWTVLAMKLATLYRGAAQKPIAGKPGRNYETTFGLAVLTVSLLCSVLPQVILEWARRAILFVLW